jgi:hypothetical protein
MIFVISFTAIILLLQKFDFRNCTRKSDGNFQSDDLDVNKAMKNDDGEDNDDDGSNTTIITVATEDSN